MGLRKGFWIVVSLVIVVLVILLVTRPDNPKPGQPPPHALDQAQ